MSMITCKEFNNLSHDEQTWYIWNGAIHLHVREVYGYRVNLFSLNGYYIELWYSIQENSIKKIKSFENSALLAPYLEDIRIDSLMNMGMGR
ncbi:MAG: hypothetical protein JSS90_05825 [Bacteroidetes bacterium]|jgi:hypothetical protein|nr:hypothetical protein [Bacteroidota bacterium]